MFGRYFSLVTLFFLSLISSASPSHAETAGDKYNGLVFPFQTHSSLKELEGTLLSSKQGYPFAISSTKDEETGMHFLLFGEKIGRKAAFIYYSTVQVIPLPEMNTGQHIMTGMLFMCGTDGKYDENLILLGKDASPDKPYNTEFSRGWRVNYQTKRLEEVPVDGVHFRCENVAHALQDGQENSACGKWRR